MKMIISIAGVSLLAIGVFAQGTVNFASASYTVGLIHAEREVVFGPSARLYNSLLTPGMNVSSNSAGVDLTGLRVGLLYAPTLASDMSSFLLATFDGDYPTFRPSTSAFAGSWLSKTATLPGVTAGQTVNMAAVVWDTRLSLNPFDPAARLCGLWGVSGVFEYTVPAGNMPHPAEYLTQDLRSFAISWAGGSGLADNSVVLEPMSFALLGLGAAAMLIFRRRS